MIYGVGLDAVGLYQPQVPGQEEELQEFRDGCSGSVHSKSQFTTQAPTAPARPQPQTHALPSFLILKNFPFIYLLGVCLCEHISAIELMWRSKNNFWESAPSLHHVCPGDQTQVFRLGNKYLYLPSHLPIYCLHFFIYLLSVCLSILPLL